MDGRKEGALTMWRSLLSCVCILMCLLVERSTGASGRELASVIDAFSVRHVGRLKATRPQYIVHKLQLFTIQQNKLGGIKVTEPEDLRILRFTGRAGCCIPAITGPSCADINIYSQHFASVNNRSERALLPKEFISRSKKK